MSIKPKPTAETKFIMNLLDSMVLDRAALIKQQMQEKRNLDVECGYPTEPSIQNYIDLYEREGIATRCNDLMPDECWSVDPDIFESFGAETASEIALKELNERISLYHYMHRLDRTAGYCTYSVMLYGIIDGRDLATAAPGFTDAGPGQGRGRPLSRPVDLAYLRIFDETNVDIVELETNESSPRLGRPKMYKIKFADVSSNVSNPSAGLKKNKTVTRDVHWSRVHHFADNCRGNENFGVPRLKPYYNRILDLRKLLGGSAEMFYKGAFPGLALETPQGIAEDVELDIDTIKDEMEMYFEKLKRYIAFKNLNVKSLAPQVASPDDHIMNQFRALAMTAGCPLRVLLGTEEGRLASNQDARNWNKKVRRRQGNVLTPLMCRPVITRIQQFGVLPPVKFNYNWQDLDAPTREDQADIAVKIANALFKYTASSAGKYVIGPEAFLSMVLGFTPDQVKEALKKLNPKMAGAVTGPQQANGAMGKKKPSKQSTDPTMSAATGQSKA